MADYGVFRTGDAKQIARAARITLGQPKRTLHVPQQIANRGSGGGGTVDVTGEIVGASTVTEYDAVTGEPINAFYRGTSRTSNQSSDFDVALTSAGNLLTCGSTNINADNGIGVLYDGTTGDILWKSDRNGLTAVTSLESGYLPQSSTFLSNKHVLEAGDGALWVAGQGSVMRLDASTGVASARVGTTGGAFSYLLPCPTSGSVIARPGASASTDRLSILNASGTRTHGYNTLNFVDADEGAGVIAVATATVLETLDASDLTQIATATPAGAGSGINTRTLCTDGTTMWIASNEGTPVFRAFDTATLTEQWNAASPTQTIGLNVLVYNPISTHIYSHINGTLRKYNSTNGTLMWTRATGSPTSRHSIAFGSDFVIVAANSTITSIWCLNDSDGSIRWSDFAGGGIQGDGAAQWTIRATGAYVNAADDRIFVSHSRKQS